MAQIRAYYEMHELAPYQPPRPVVPDPNYIPERERPTHSRDGHMIIAWGDGWVDVLNYTVLQRIER